MSYYNTSVSSFATFNWISFREKFNFSPRRGRNKGRRDVFAWGEGMFEKRKEESWRWTELKIRQRMTQASFSAAVGGPHAYEMHGMYRTGNSDIPATGWAALIRNALSGSVHRVPRNSTMQLRPFPFCSLLPVWANVESRVVRRDDIRTLSQCRFIVENRSYSHGYKIFQLF